jgi:hypothetical protein
MHTIDESLLSPHRKTRVSIAGVSRDVQRKLDYLAANRPDVKEAVAARRMPCDAAYREATGLVKRLYGS